MPPANLRGQRVAIVSDGSVLPAGSDLTATLHDEAELIGDLARIQAQPTVILVADAAGLAAGVRALPSDIGAVLLTKVEPERARQVQWELANSGARPLVTEEDVTAIALTAAVLDSLAKAGRRARGNRVVFAGASDLPVLTPLLIAAGVDDISIWNRSDARNFPLRSVVLGADIVIDLVGELVAPVAAGTTVLTHDDTKSAPYVVAAGLLRAASRVPGAVFDIEIYRACAQALATSSPFIRSAPFVTGVALVQRVSDVVTTVFHRQLSQ